MGKGLCAQAQALPCTGEHGLDDIDDYKKVCKLIERAKLSGSKVEPFDSLGSTQLTVNWVDRFS